MGYRLLVFVAVAGLTLFQTVEVRTASSVAPVYAGGLRSPVKIISVGNVLLVSEAGVRGEPNTGGVTIVNRFGDTTSLIDGLPSGAYGPDRDPSGPSGLVWDARNNRLYIAIGAGDSNVFAAGGVELPNPNPSSPLFSSVLALDFPAGEEFTTGGFNLFRPQHDILAGGSSVALRNPRGEHASLSLVVDFPNSTPQPRPGNPNAVRPSNPFDMQGTSGTHLDVVDASQDAVFRVDIGQGTYRPLAAMPKFQNPTPIGPPVLDAVPTGAGTVGNSLLVTLHTGFPFPEGFGTIVEVVPATGEVFPVTSGGTRPTDILIPPDESVLYVAEFGSGGAPDGTLVFIDESGGHLIADNLVSPVGIGFEPGRGDLVVAEFETGNLVGPFPK